MTPHHGFDVFFFFNTLFILDDLDYEIQCIQLIELGELCRVREFEISGKHPEEPCMTM